MGRVFGPFGAAARLGVPASTLESKSEAPAPSAQDRRQISLGGLVGSKFLEPFGLAMGRRRKGLHSSTCGQEVAVSVGGLKTVGLPSVLLPPPSGMLRQLFPRGLPNSINRRHRRAGLSIGAYNRRMYPTGCLAARAGDTERWASNDRRFMHETT